MARTKNIGIIKLRMIYADCYKELYKYAHNTLEDEQRAKEVVIDSLITYFVSKKVHRSQVSMLTDLRQQVVFDCKYYSVATKKNERQRKTLALLLKNIQLNETISLDQQMPLRIETQKAKQAFRLLYLQGARIGDTAHDLQLTVEEIENYYQQEQNFICMLLRGAEYDHQN